jgi:hypothetical protein
MAFKLWTDLLSPQNAWFVCGDSPSVLSLTDVSLHSSCEASVIDKKCDFYTCELNQKSPTSNLFVKNSRLMNGVKAIISRKLTLANSDRSRSSGSAIGDFSILSAIHTCLLVVSRVSLSALVNKQAVYSSISYNRLPTCNTPYHDVTLVAGCDVSDQQQL